MKGCVRVQKVFSHLTFLVADTRLYTLPCQLVSWQFAKLKREILSDLEAELQEDSLRKESLRKKRLVDMNLPIGVMHKSEVYEECAKRLNVNENDLPWLCSAETRTTRIY